MTGVAREPFGETAQGGAVERITLTGACGFEARILTFGATLQTLAAPDRDGKLADVVLGHDDLAGYLGRRGFYGATVGRFANRIAGAAFPLDGATVRLEANDGGNALHGGTRGFDRHVWTIAETGGGPWPFVRLHRRSPNGEEGYPGTLDVGVTYGLTGPFELTIAFEARTDRPTVVSLTNHSFFNLAGAGSGADALDHRLTVAADGYLAIGPDAIPLPGPPRPVLNTPFDFRSPRPIGARIGEADEQLARGLGYDHAFVLRGPDFAFAARLEDPRSGRALALFTDHPALQVYSGNRLDGSETGKGGRVHRRHDALCLEPEAFPDAPNRPDAPSARLDPGGVWRRRIVYRLSAA